MIRIDPHHWVVLREWQSQSSNPLYISLSPSVIRDHGFSATRKDLQQRSVKLCHGSASIGDGGKMAYKEWGSSKRTLQQVLWCIPQITIRILSDHSWSFHLQIREEILDWRLQCTQNFMQIYMSIQIDSYLNLHFLIL